MDPRHAHALGLDLGQPDRFEPVFLGRCGVVVGPLVWRGNRGDARSLRVDQPAIGQGFGLLLLARCLDAGAELDQFLAAGLGGGQGLAVDTSGAVVRT